MFLSIQSKWVGSGRTLDPIDFQCMAKKNKHSTEEKIQVWKDMRVNKWWQLFLVNYTYKRSYKINPDAWGAAHASFW